MIYTVLVQYHDFPYLSIKNLITAKNKKCERICGMININVTATFSLTSIIVANYWLILKSSLLYHVIKKYKMVIHSITRLFMTIVSRLLIVLDD